LPYEKDLSQTDSRAKFVEIYNFAQILNKSRTISKNSLTDSKPTN